jgi:2-polyprenyl-3-methyl-5-hydroxy-6-metoxy-1,4-benzoquinol methylase
LSTPTNVLDSDACPACLTPGHATSLTPSLPDGGNATLLRCPSCGTEYWRLDTTGVDDESEYWEEYKFDLYADGSVQNAYEERYERMLLMIEGLGFHPHSFLDIGGGIGNFAAWLAERGVTVYMTDIDSSAVTAARERGVQAVESKDLGSLVPVNGVDAVTLWDVIEHVANPATFVTEALTRLRPGGVLFFETPDARFPLRKAVIGVRAASRGRVDKTGALYYWEHKVYFTERGMAMMLTRLGARMVAVERWTSPRAKMTKLLGSDKALGTSAFYRGIGRIYPYADTGIERMRLGNKLIVVATKVI